MSEKGKVCCRRREGLSSEGEGVRKGKVEWNKE